MGLIFWRQGFRLCSDQQEGGAFICLYSQFDLNFLEPSGVFGPVMGLIFWRQGFRIFSDQQEPGALICLQYQFDLNFLETSGYLGPVMGMIYLYIYVHFQNNAGNEQALWPVCRKKRAGSGWKEQVGKRNLTGYRRRNLKVSSQRRPKFWKISEKIERSVCDVGHNRHDNSKKDNGDYSNIY